MDQMTVELGFGAAWWRAQMRELRAAAIRELARRLVQQAVRRWFLRMQLCECLQQRVNQLQQQGD